MSTRTVLIAEKVKLDERDASQTAGDRVAGTLGDRTGSRRLEMRRDALGKTLPRGWLRLCGYASCRSSDILRRPHCRRRPARGLRRAAATPGWWATLAPYRKKW